MDLSEVVLEETTVETVSLPRGGLFALQQKYEKSKRSTKVIIISSIALILALLGLGLWYLLAGRITSLEDLYSMYPNGSDKVYTVAEIDYAWDDTRGIWQPQIPTAYTDEMTGIVQSQTDTVKYELAQLQSELVALKTKELSQNNVTADEYAQYSALARTLEEKVESLTLRFDSLNVQDGVDGRDGADGSNGKNGTDGADGSNGKNGEKGTDGADGKDGADGSNGKNGEKGTDGADGKDGLDGAVPYIGAVTNTWMIGDVDTGVVALGVDGTDGKSAYELYKEQLVSEGNTPLTESAWLQTLSPFEYAKATNPNITTVDEYMESLTAYGIYKYGLPDKSTALSQTEWLLGLKGDKGEAGLDGRDG